MPEKMLYDGDGCTSVSLAALGVMGNTTDQVMRYLYDCADCEFVVDCEKTQQDNERAQRALDDTPLRDPIPFETNRAGKYLHMRPLEVSSEDVACALESYHGSGGFTWTRHTGSTQWWKDRHGKYIVSGELSCCSLLPDDDGVYRKSVYDWIDLAMGVDADNTTGKHVIAVSGGKFYCKNIKKWLSTKYLWIGKRGRPLKHRHNKKLVSRGIFKTIDCVYKVDVHDK
jgi:hypothetical protein